MAERLHPGVYVEEVSSGIRPIEGVSTSTAAFLGEAARGMPGVAHFVTSFEDYTRIFGGHRSGKKGYLAHAVASFFAAGGRRAYVVRVLSSNATRGESDDIDALYKKGATDAGASPKALKFVAKGDGVWADALRVEISKSPSMPGEAFDIEVSWVESGTVRVLETHTGLRMDPSREDYVVDMLETASRYIEAVDAFQKDLQADAPTYASIPEARPSLGFKPLGAGETYKVPDGAEVTFRWSNATTGEQKQKTVKLQGTQSGNRTALELASNLKDHFAAAGDGDPNAFVVVPDPAGGDPPAGTAFRVEARVATRPRLLLTPAVATPGANTYDLSGWTLGIKQGDDAAVELTFPGMDADALQAVSVAKLAERLKAALPTAKVIVRGSEVLVLGERRASGNTLVFSQAKQGGGADIIQTASKDGAAGAVIDDFDALSITASEKLQVGVKSLLTATGLAARGRAYEENSPANPLLLPDPTHASNVRLAGGTDGPAHEELTVSDYEGDKAARTGLYAFDGVDVNIVAIPGQNDPVFITKGIAYCEGRGDCFFLADGPGDISKDFEIGAAEAKQFIEGLPVRSNNAAMYFPWIRIADPVGVGKNPTRFVPPSGHMAGIFARTDVSRGVWKAPAGIEAVVTGALDLQGRPLVDADQDILNPVSLNCLRKFAGTGIVAWGARTLASDPEWRYVPVRRMALFLKESLRRGLKWAVFEPNDQELWDQIRTNITAFMLGLFRQGAFQGATPDEAFRVRCDRSTNPQELVDAGIVTAQVAFAPLKPAEFVVIEISQKSLVS